MSSVCQHFCFSVQAKKCLSAMSKLFKTAVTCVLPQGSSDCLDPFWVWFVFCFCREFVFVLTSLFYYSIESYSSNLSLVCVVKIIHLPRSELMFLINFACTFEASVF